MAGTFECGRRGFIKAAFGGGALIATSSLPSFAEDNPSVFPQRGRYERLSLNYVRVEAGATSPFSVLHISDTHLTAAYPHEGEKKLRLSMKRTKTFGGRQEEALADSLAWARHNADYVIHTGDLIDWQSEANLDLVRKYFGKNITGAVGNHEMSPDMEASERTEEYRAKSRPVLSSAFPFDLTFQSTVVNGVNFITLDDIYGTVSEKQVELFSQEVKKGLPIVLAMHVPFFTDLIRIADAKFWYWHKDENGNERDGVKFRSGKVPASSGDISWQLEDKVTGEFIRYLKSEKLLKAILAGHLHITIQDRFSPTAMEYVVGPNFMFHGQEVLFV